ncbi:hypothetical protein SAMN05192553_10494 [Cyclobacterium xiamenense]|uniref:Uncharacterized protein n=1 Tax=Cyclobacterium xiamenense TaxID=1297121 RepID=A0A1H6Z358_9BACT|nr:hypothetical protein SAMN05192553_10494 [Cyclobacterium xiamenense]
MGYYFEKRPKDIRPKAVNEGGFSCQANQSEEPLGNCAWKKVAAAGQEPIKHQKGGRIAVSLYNWARFQECYKPPI